jgi:hypothetical protein
LQIPHHFQSAEIDGRPEDVGLPECESEDACDEDSASSPPVELRVCGKDQGYGENIGVVQGVEEK